MEQLSIPQTNIEEPVKDRAVSFCCAILFTVTAYLLWTSVIHERALLFWISASVLFTITLITGLLKGAKPNVLTIITYLCGVVFSAHAWINGIFFADAFIYANALIFVYAIFTLSLFANHTRVLRTGTILLDAVKSVFLYPFISFTAYFCTLFRWNTRSKRVGKNILFVLIGIGAALVLGVAAIALLSFDANFKELFRFDFNWEDFPEAILKLMISVPCAALLFSAFRSSEEHRLPQFSSVERAESIGNGLKKVPAVIFLIPTLTLLFIYGLFFFSQWTVYMSAFSGVLPEEYTYAEYARNGFFELCVVALINAAFSAAFQIFAKDASPLSGILRKISNTLLAVATLILIATALSKMMLYIKSYDLTYLRLFTSVIMLLLAIGFLLSVFAQWFRRIRVFPVMLVLTCALLLAVPFLNVRGQIARYNVNAYLEREEQGVEGNKIDCDYLLYDLGDAAIPEAVRLLESGKLSKDEETKLFRKLEGYHSALLKQEPFHNTLAGNRARHALDSYLNQ